MRPFDYTRVVSLPEAIRETVKAGTMPFAGGTELLNWMKESIVAPRRLVDINGLAELDFIESDGQGLVIGALARMSSVAAHATVRRDYPAIAEALVRSASPQIRNMASMGGNLMQRTRCSYFRAEVELPCNKRRPRSGCSALQGETRGSAIFGWRPDCIATHPSDVAVALAALDAVIRVAGPDGTRTIPFADFYRRPEEEEAGTALRSGEIITAIAVPTSAAARRSAYVKVRERASYEFALVSAAAGLDLAGDRIREARIALGGVAPRPWRLVAAEDALRGASLTDASALHRAFDVDFAAARPLGNNSFKVDLARRTAIRALQIAGEIA